ncbi:Tagatose-6-phosphate kinase [bioreactor metagenome]|uniref:Tagatose-6-phosphate kinase n=1 Tax=bioreactor metagenome TaxID=1076179 RepID=A0A644Y287_9ZZZZ
MTNPKPVILTVGANPAWQKVLHFNQFAYGKVNRADSLMAFASGKGINFCRAARVWDAAETRLVQFAGGHNGMLLTADLDREGLKHETIASEAPTRCCSTCLSEADNVMTELIEPSRGPGRKAEEAALRWLEKALPDAAAVALCGQLPAGMEIDFYVRCAQLAARSDVPILIDSWQKIVPVLEAARHATLKINTEELLALTGISAIVPAMRSLLQRHELDNVAITGGADAAYFARGNEVWILEVPRLERVENPVGSGDTASAVFWSEYLRGRTPVEAFRAGLAAASANCLSMLCGSFDPATARRFYDQIVVTRIYQP